MSDPPLGACRARPAGEAQAFSEAPSSSRSHRSGKVMPLPGGNLRDEGGRRSCPGSVFTSRMKGVPSAATMKSTRAAPAQPSAR